MNETITLDMIRESLVKAGLQKVRQLRGNFSDGRGGVCAMGWLARDLKLDREAMAGLDYDELPKVFAKQVRCPLYEGTTNRNQHCWMKRDHLGEVIQHLNDDHELDLDHREEVMTLDDVRESLAKAALLGVRQLVGRMEDHKGGYCAMGWLREDLGLDRPVVSEWIIPTGCPMVGELLAGETSKGIACRASGRMSLQLLVEHLNDSHRCDFLTIGRKL